MHRRCWPASSEWGDARHADKQWSISYGCRVRGNRAERPEWQAGNHRAVLAILVAHGCGAVFTFGYLTYIAPSEPAAHPGSALGDIALFVGYALIAFPVTGAACERVAKTALRWMIERRDPTDDERRLTLTLARRIATVTAVPW